jgi:hypothetical protein
MLRYSRQNGQFLILVTQLQLVTQYLLKDEPRLAIRKNRVHSYQRRESLNRDRLSLIAHLTCHDVVVVPASRNKMP